MHAGNTTARLGLFRQDHIDTLRRQPYRSQRSSKIASILQPSLEQENNITTAAQRTLGVILLVATVTLICSQRDLGETSSRVPLSCINPERADV